jgi:hypothetical protein
LDKPQAPELRPEFSGANEASSDNAPVPTLIRKKRLIIMAKSVGSIKSCGVYAAALKFNIGVICRDPTLSYALQHAWQFVHTAVKQGGVAR